MAKSQKTEQKTKQPLAKRLFNTYVIDALSYMAMGLFCSLILGLIISQIAKIPGLDFLAEIARLLQLDLVVGGSIGLAIALGLKRGGEAVTTHQGTEGIVARIRW